MILRNGVEIKKINKEFSRLNLLIRRMRGNGVSESELIDLQVQIEGGLMNIATYMDKIDKVWVNAGKMRNIYTDYNTLIENFNNARAETVNVGRNINYGSTEDLFMRSEDKIKSNISYLNNAGNSRTKDRVHYFATRGLGLILAGALMVGSWSAIDRYRDMKNDYDTKVSASETLKNENNALQEENKALEAEKNALDAEIQELKGQISGLQEELEEAKKNNDSAKITELEEKIAELNKELAETVSAKEYNELLTTHNKTQEELTKAQAEITRLNNELKNADSAEKVKELEGKIKEKEAEIVELQGKLDKLDEIISENEKLKEEKSGLEDSLEAANEKIAKLEADLEAAKNDGDDEKIKTLEEKLKEAKEAKASIETSLKEANKKIGNLEKTIADLNKENTELKAENDKLKAENAEGNALIERIDSMYAEMFGNDGASKSATEKLNEIVEKQLNNGDAMDEEMLRLYAISRIVNVTYISYEEVAKLSDAEILEILKAIDSGVARPSDGPTNGNVNEETNPSTPENGEEAPGDDEISPDHGIVHE